jgi:hypothetical protein
MMLLLLACTAGTDTGDTAASACTDAPNATWASFGDGFFATYCRACHSASTAERYGAPEAVNFDSLADIRTFEASIRRTVLDDESMPVGGGVYDDDALLLDTFLTCGL